MSRSPSPVPAAAAPAASVTPPLSISAASPHAQQTPSSRAPLHPAQQYASPGGRTLGDVLKSPGVAASPASVHFSPHPGVNPKQLAAAQALRSSLSIPPAHPLSTPVASSGVVSAPAATSSSGGWFSGWIGQAVAAASPFPQSSQPQIPPSTTVAAARAPMAKTGDEMLDQYAASVDAMQGEIEEARRKLLEYAERIIGMSTSGSTLAEYARHLASEAPLDPAALLAFADAHDQSAQHAEALFREEFELEVLDPLSMWHEESEQFLRELQRTALAYKKQEEVRSKVDRLMMAQAERALEATEDGGDDDVEAEMQLRIAKTDLGETCTNYSVRCNGLKRHYSDINVGRAQALDVAFTRFMAQQSFLLRPTLRIVEAQLNSDAAAALLSPAAQSGLMFARNDGGGGGGAGAFFASPRKGGPRFSSATLPTPRGLSGGRKSTLEEDIIRMSHRVNRKMYQPQGVSHHYHGGINGQAGGGGGGGGDGDGASDLHPALKGGQRVVRMGGVTTHSDRRPSIARAEDSAILSACRQLQEEIVKRSSTEAVNEDLRKQLEALKQEAGGTQASLSAQSEIEELKKKLNEREAALAAAQSNGANKSAEPVPEVAAVPIPDAPMAPPMDIPAPPPMAPPGAPGIHSSTNVGGLKHRVLTAREKEIADAMKYGLPILPDVEPIQSSMGTEDGGVEGMNVNTERIMLKKLHWQTLTPEEVLGEQSNSTTTTSTTPAKANMWRKVFMRSAEAASTLAASNEAIPTAERKLSVNASITDEDELAKLVAPLVPNTHVDSAVESSDSSSTPSSEPFSWRWSLDIPSFASSFAQKATQAMKKRPAKKANKYALGRAGSKESQAGLNEDGVEEGEEDDDASGDDLPEENADGSVTPHSTRKRKPAAPKALPRVDLIDAKRSYNVSISLTHFRLAPEVVRDAILSFDEEGRLKDAAGNSGTGDLLDILLDILPTSEEIKLIDEWISAGGDPTRLGDVERFFLAMSQPGLAARLKVLNSLETFSQTASAIEDNLEAVHAGLRGLDGAESAIAVVLSIVLRIGNLMNTTGSFQVQPAGPAAPAATLDGAAGDAPKQPQPKKLVRTMKQAYGFQVLSTLHKLRAVKALESATATASASAALTSADGAPLAHPPPPPTTLLHFLVSYTHAHVPAAASSLRNLCGQLRDCSRVEQAFVQAEIKHLGQSLKAMKLMIDEDARKQEIEKLRLSAAGVDGSVALEPLASPTASGVAAASSDATSASAAAAVVAPYVPLPRRIHEFYDYASGRLQAIERQLALLQTLYADLLSYYLIIDQAGTPWESFISGWSLFLLVTVRSPIGVFEPLL